MVLSGKKKKATGLNLSRKVSLRLLGATAAAAATVLTTAAALAQNSFVEIDGSSTVFPITEAMAEEFMDTPAGEGVNISVGVSGTGGGFKKFCDGETVISNASRPIKQKEIDQCAANGIEYEVIPVAFDAITVVINPANDWATELSTEELANIWDSTSEGSISNWSQVDDSFPDAPLNLFGPGSDSGTFDYFNEEILGKEGASRGDYTASEDDNVLVLGVSRDVNALGYFGMSYYLENQDILQPVGIASEDTNGEYVVPSPETVEADAYKPLAREIYIYVNKASLATRPEVASFVEYYLDNVDPIVPEVGYVLLPGERYQTGRDILASYARAQHLNRLRGDL